MKRQTRTGSTCGDRSTSAKVMLAALVLTGTAASALGQGGLPAWIEPPEGSVRFGSSVASGADVDGDRFNDIFVSDPGVVTGVGLVGAWYVYSGATRELLWSVVGQDLVETDGLQLQYRLPAAFIDDFDGDDLPDLLIGRGNALESRGVVEVYRGRTGELLHRITGDEQGDYVGIDVALLGDLNGDDTSEFCIVRWNSVEIRSGISGELLESIAVENARRVRNAGDVDGDLIPDLAVGRYFASLPNGLDMYSGATAGLIWSLGRPNSGDSLFGYNFATGHDLDGDDVPDVLVTGDGKSRVYVVSGDSAELRLWTIGSGPGAPAVVDWLALSDLTGNGRAEPIVGYVIGPPDVGKRFNVYDYRPGAEPLGDAVYTVDWEFQSGVIFGTELCAADVSGDNCSEVILGSAQNTSVHIIAGSPMLFGHDSDTYAAFGEREVQRGTLAKFAAFGNVEGRPVRLAVSRRGNGCTFIPQLGICIDLDRPFQQIGQAATGADGFARFSVTIPPNAALGPAWLQCLDVNFPGRGPTTSNVMRVDIIE